MIHILQYIIGIIGSGQRVRQKVEDITIYILIVSKTAFEWDAIHFIFYSKKKGDLRTFTLFREDDKVMKLGTSSLQHGKRADQYASANCKVMKLGISPFQHKM